MSKLCRKMKPEDVESSDDEVSTPDKKVITLNDDGDIDAAKTSKSSAKDKRPMDSPKNEVKVKRRLDDEFSTSSAVAKQKGVFIKKEKF